MPLDQAMVGATLAGLIGLASQCISKLRCYTSGKRNDDNEVCERQIFCGFMDSTLLETAEGLASHAAQGRGEPESPD